MGYLYLSKFIFIILKMLFNPFKLPLLTGVEGAAIFPLDEVIYFSHLR
jgi:hypothetical protein